MHNSTQMFLIMDHDQLPAHIKQTFRLVQEGNHWTTELSQLNVAVEGDVIDEQAPGYAVVFASNSWHARAALNLYEQIKNIRPGMVVMMLPVEVEVKEEEDRSPFLLRGVPFPGIPMP